MGYPFSLLVISLFSTWDGEICLVLLSNFVLRHLLSFVFSCRLVVSQRPGDLLKILFLLIDVFLFFGVFFFFLFFWDYV